MAQKVKVLLLCDLHAEEVEGQETIQFALDGAAYEIDVCAKHASELRDKINPFVGSARRAGGSRRRRARGAASRERSAEIRAWAKGRGIKVNERGRIPASIVQQYESATG